MGFSLLDPVKGLVNGVLGEDTTAKLPVVGALFGSQTDAQKQLLQKQQEMAEEARKRQELNAQARLTALGQSMLAFNPRNQMMAQVYGPQAAFSPQQMQQMVADPRVHQQPWGTGTRQQREEQAVRGAGNQQRAPIFNQLQQPGAQQTPPPFGMPAPQAARRF